MLAPVPEVVIPPGALVNVQAPIAGKPLNTTLPVATLHVGLVTVPRTGAVGVAGCAFITTFDEAIDVHPDALVTVNV